MSQWRGKHRGIGELLGWGLYSIVSGGTVRWRNDIQWEGKHVTGSGRGHEGSLEEKLKGDPGRTWMSSVGEAAIAKISDAAERSAEDFMLTES